MTTRRRRPGVLGQVRLPGLRLQHRGTRAAAVLVQQPGRRLRQPATAWVSSSSSIPARWSRNPELSLAGGAVRGWDRRNAYYFQMIRSLGEHYGFDLETPVGRAAATTPADVML